MSDAPSTTSLHHVTNICTDIERTQAFYEEVLGFHTVKKTQNYDDPGTRHYYFSATPEGDPGTTVTYFESIYFTDPDGLVLEIATAGPGFGVDEGAPGSTEIDPHT